MGTIHIILKEKSFLLFNFDTMFWNNESKRVKKLESEIEGLKQASFLSGFSLRGFNQLVSPNMSPEKAISEGYQKNATIFSIVDLLVKSACNVIPRVYRIRDQGALKEHQSLSQGMGDGMTQVKAQLMHQRALQPMDGSPLHELLRNPNPRMGYAEWLQEVLGFKYLTGNSFIQGEQRSGTGRVYELNVWPAQFTQISHKNLEILGYAVVMNDMQLSADVNEIAHIKNFNPEYSSAGSHFYGQSPIKAAYANLTINNDAISTGSNIIKQQGTRGMVVPDPNSDMLYGKEQAQAMESKYIEKHTMRGRHGVNSGILWPSAAMKWINMSLPAADLALLEQYNTSIKDLCGIYKVPSILLNDTAESKVESYREAKKYMYQQGVFPELVALRDELNRWLTPQFGKDLYIDFDFMSVPEVQEDMEKVTKQLNLAWWTTPNEKRQIMKFPPLEDADMDKIYVPANLLNLSDGVQGELEGGDP